MEEYILAALDVMLIFLVDSGLKRLTHHSFPAGMEPDVEGRKLHQVSEVCLPSLEYLARPVAEICSAARGSPALAFCCIESFIYWTRFL